MALRLIHTADWHLGQTFFGYDREAEHEAFLGLLTNLLVERQTDVLLIAGDVFDVTNPSAGAQRRFYRFLREANPNFIYPLFVNLQAFVKKLVITCESLFLSV